MVDAIRRGDADAEVRLYDYFGPRIQFLARRDARTAGLAEDVRSEALLRSLTAIRDGRLSTPEALSGFILQIARNVIHEFGRQHQRLVSNDEAPAREPAIDRRPFQYDGERTALRRALVHLKERDRILLHLHFVEDLPRPEIAKRLGIDQARVRLVKSRALRRIRDAYERAIRTSN